MVGALRIKLAYPAQDDSTVGASLLPSIQPDCSANVCLNMPSASIDLDELERGTGTGQVSSGAHEAVAAATDQARDNCGGINLEGSDSTTIPRATVEDGIGPGK